MGTISEADVEFIKRPQGQDVQADRTLTETVQNIIDQVRERGDAALRDYSAKFDKTTPDKFEVSEHDIETLPGAHPAMIAICYLAGAHRIFKVGGAQAIAAMAWGTESVPVVDKVVGPGNAFVNEAKRQVFGKVGIDALAGPSEIL